MSNRANRRLAAHGNIQADVAEKMRLASSGRTRRETVGWKQAVKMMESNNIGFIRSEERAKKALKANRKAWLTLLPKLFIFSNISSAIGEIADISSDDVSFSAVANLAIPNPIHFYGRLYANKLEILRAGWQHELTRRSLHVQLYRLFQRSEQIARQEAELRQAEDMSQMDLWAVSKAIYNTDLKKHSLDAQKESQRVSINRLFATPGKNWHLAGRLPRISYAKRINNLSLDNGYGKLGLMLQTIQIEGTTLSVWNVKLKRIPQFNLGLSSPPIYQSQGGNSKGFESDNIRFFSGLSQGISLDDPLNREDLKDTQTRVKHTRKMLMLTTEQEASKLNLLKKNYRRILSQRRLLESELLSLQSRVSQAKDADGTLKNLRKQEALKQSLGGVEERLTQMDLQLWPWDEKYWKTYLK